MKRTIVAAVTLSFCFSAHGDQPAGAAPWAFEKEPHALAAGRSPKFVARRAHGLLMVMTAPGKGGQDLIFRSSSDVGDSFTPPQRINHILGEVSDHGENSPQLLVSPDESTLYAVWNGKDPNIQGGSHIRFSRSGAMMPSWSPAVTVNDDGLPVSHAFQTAAVAPDGTIYIAWLDGRDKDTEGHMPGTSSIYLSRSVDGGKTFEKNIRIARNICPCCRLSIAFAMGRVLVAWRSVESGDVRDIYVAASADRGVTWEKPVLVARDGWKISGCPHVGPAMASIGDKLYVTWFSEGASDPAIYLASSSDGGKSFSAKRKISEGTHDPTHPQVAAGDGKLAVVFQARDASRESGWGRMGVYYREIDSSGTISSLVRAGEGKVNANYPSVAIGLSGRIFLGWTETSEGVSKAYLLRGRATPQNAVFKSQ